MKITTYILIWIFSIGAFIPKCDFSQLAKIGDLLAHYELHQKEAQLDEVSFLDFLYLHFVTGNEHEHPNSGEHQKLPLQAFSTQITIFIQTKISLEIPMKPLSTRGFNNIVRTFLIKDFTTSIFRPPIVI